MNERPSYDQVDNEGRHALLSARDDSLKKSWVHELWMKVIIIAIEDISFCEIYYGEGISTWLKLASSETNSFTDLLKISFRLLLILLPLF